MGKRAKLTEALRQASGGKDAENNSDKVASETTDKTQESVAAKSGDKASGSGKYVAPSRKGKKVISIHADPEVSYQLKQIALEEDSSLQMLVAEAINDLFVKRGKPPIA